MKTPKRQRNRTAEQYHADIAARENALGPQREKLGRFRRQMEAIQKEFRAARSVILQAETRRTRRPESSGLTLEMTVSAVTGAPRAVWKHYVRLKRNRNSAAPHITEPIHKHRKYEWVPDELAQHAHHSELSLVCETEAKLAFLRRKVWPLSKAAQANAIAATQLTNQLWELQLGGGPKGQPTKHPQTVSQGRDSIPAWARDPEPEEEKYVPQFKHPDGVL